MSSVGAGGVEGDDGRDGEGRADGSLDGVGWEADILRRFGVCDLRTASDGALDENVSCSDHVRFGISFSFNRRGSPAFVLPSSCGSSGSTLSAL